MRSPGNIIDEVSQLVEKCQIHSFTFVDDTFTALPQRVLNICDLIKSHGLNITWGCATRADMVDFHLLESMAAAGCREIQFWVESANDLILQQIKKGVRRSQIDRSIGAARSAWIKVYCSFMIPHPGDTPDTLSETMAYIKSLLTKTVGISISITTPFPGTALWNDPKSYGVEILSEDWFDYDCCTPVFETKHFKKRDIYRILSDLSFRSMI